MEPEFITYRKFNDIALANELIELLDENGIKYYMQEETSGFDPSMVMSNAPVDYAIKIKSEDFEQVNRLLKENETKNIEGVDDDHYLFSFTGSELIDVIAKADEWSVFDTLLARKILAERGKPISEKTISDINEKRIEELKTPEPPQTFWIIIGYMAAVLGGVLGLFIGWHLKFHKKTLPNGERVYEYSDGDRWHGKIIFYIALIGTAFSIIYKLWPFFRSN